MTDLDSLTSFFSENSFGVIIGMLGIFFLLASIVKGARNRRERQLRADTEAAAANGGTPEAPVHIGNPFEIAPPPELAQPQEGTAAQEGAPASTPASGEAGSESGAPAPTSPDEDKYVWE